MEKLNIAELLKDCPQGMELYSPIFGKVYLDKIRPHLAIVVTTDKKQDDFKEEFLYDGRYGMNGECMLFPSKDKTTWEGFHRPFKDEDVVVAEDSESLQLFLLKYLISSRDDNSHDGYCYFGWGFQDNKLFKKGNWGFNRLATEEEKQKLFDAIKANGYRWNSETKTLEKLIVPKFNVGDIVQNKDYYKVKITEVNIEDACYGYESLIAHGIGGISFNEQNNWELVPSKFDITTLKPFDKVLIRDTNGQVWTTSLFSHIINTYSNLRTTFVCVGNCPNQCIPYEGNEHLLGTSNDCDDFYKTWE